MQFGKIGTVIAACAMLIGCRMPVVDNKDVERVKETPKLTYKQLTTESSYPFALGRLDIIDEYHHEAIKAYPTVRDCLIEKEKLSDNPDLRLIDWKTIRLRSELEICLWRIFTSLEDFDTILKWMDFHHIEWGRQQKPSVRKYADLRGGVNADGVQVKYAWFYWKDKLPFMDKAPVPDLFTDFFVLAITFDQSSEKITTLWVRWEQTI